MDAMMHMCADMESKRESKIRRHRPFDLGVASDGAPAQLGSPG